MKIEFSGIKTYIGSQLVIIPTGQYDELKKLPNGEICQNTIKTINDKRRISTLQHDLYWACCNFIAQNTEDENKNTQKKVDEWCKYKCNLIEFSQYVDIEVAGKKTTIIHHKTGSISFDNLPHLERCAYFTEAFQVMANFVDMPINDFINAVKETMGDN